LVTAEQQKGFFVPVLVPAKVRGQRATGRYIVRADTEAEAITAVKKTIASSGAEHELTGSVEPAPADAVKRAGLAKGQAWFI
jgi:hypothetical protein